jgi:membrane-associated phospholipid phosphatase
MSCQKCMGVILFILLFLLQICAFVCAQEKIEDVDVFSQNNIKIEPSQTIHRLLIANADAIVAGRIEEGIIVVDGNLTITQEAQINGKIIIFGGKLQREAGAKIENTPWVISANGIPMKNIVIGIFFLLFILPVVIFPFILWWAMHFLRNIAWYRYIKRQFFRLQHRWPYLYIVSTLAISGVTLVVFSELAWKTIFRHTMGAFDNAFIWLVRYFATERLDQTMIVVTNFGYGYTYRFIVLATFFILMIQKRWLEVKGLLICLLGGVVLNELLKHLFERARPDAFRVVEAAGYSFPSGHAMVSLCFYGMIAFLIARNIPLWRWRLVVMVSAALFILSIGISRIYLGVHYPSDVLAGYTAGTMWLAFSISLLMWWERKYRYKEKALKR